MSVVTGGSEPGPAAASAAGGGAGGGTRVFFQSPRGGSASREDSVAPAAVVQVQQQQQRRHQQGKVTVKYDRKELRKRLVLEEWIVEQLGQLYGCEVPVALALLRSPFSLCRRVPTVDAPSRRGAEASAPHPLTVRLPFGRAEPLASGSRGRGSGCPCLVQLWRGGCAALGHLATPSSRG